MVSIVGQEVIKTLPLSRLDNCCVKLRFFKAKEDTGPVS